MVSRTQRTPFGNWWWTVDRMMIAACAGLMLAGVVLCLAASPPVASRLNLDAFHFVNRQVMFLIPSIGILLLTSVLSPRQVRRTALVVFAVSLVLVALTPFYGAEIKGARRWLVIAGVNIQPSEFLKPAFVILVAWLFGESAKRPEMPANTAALSLLLVVVCLLVMQPDFGQTMLVLSVWGALFFMAGMRVIWVAGLAGVASIGLVGAYFTVPHVARRIKRFMDPASGDTFNVDLAMESFARGGWTGRGPGEGTVKRILPESHTDFVFAVAAEEFGIVLCLMLLLAPALLMGFPMPTAMTMLGRLGKDHMFLWAWGINGCFSVIGAALVPIVATSFGLPAVVLVGAVAYLVALPAFFSVLMPLSNGSRSGRPASA